MRTLAERFWEKVDKRGPTPAHCPELGPCWVWTAFRDGNGYGRIILKGNKCGTASRVSWELTHGEAGELFVLHKCDNPPCVNPGHLFLGTSDDNMQDMKRKGRSPKPRGEQHHSAKLTVELVRSIRDEHARGGVTMKALARRMKLDPSSIRAVIRRESWKSA